MTPDEQVAFVKAALTEAGCGEYPVGWCYGRCRGRWDVPRAPWWVATELLYQIVGKPHACWLCWADKRSSYKGQGAACAAGNCSHPGEDRYPPRHLLQRPQEVAR